jgi:hypothetical protein
MMEKNFVKPVVVVPVHKALPDEMEIVSLRQCGRSLGQHDILVLAPERLDLGPYRELMPVLDEIRVPACQMGSVQAYNQLMISPWVYNAVRGYTHMLIHEPDAIVLRDELHYWCSQPYDYIGAPWFEGYTEPDPDAQILGVGNFGLSLHGVEAALKVMNSNRRWYPLRDVAGDLVNGLRGDRVRLTKAILGMGSAGKLRQAWKLYVSHCDIFWSRLVPHVYSDFQIASIEDAMRFSWEALPDKCFKLCNGNLPFGIHAWARYDLPFLLPYLKSSGVSFVSRE